MLHVVSLLSLMLSLPLNDACMHLEITVPQCSPENYTTCNNLDNALKQAQSTNSNVAVRIPPGHYPLTGSHQFRNKSGISLIGSGKDSTILKCYGSYSGIAFKSSSQIEVHNLSMVDCGAKHISTSREIHNCTAFFPFQVALYFEFCEHVTVSGVVILHSNGTGLAFLNTVGWNQISNSRFCGGKVNHNKQIPGGGGLYVEFANNVPWSTNAASDTNIHVSEATYHVSSCQFQENQATPGNVNTKVTKYLAAQYCSDTCSDHFLFGKGGGMAVHLNGNASRNNITIRESNFTGNSAERGGGLIVGFGGNSTSNKVEIISNTFEMNNCFEEPHPASRFSTGGGAKIDFESKFHNNQAIINKCSFKNNSAYWGGALSIYSTTILHMDISTRDTLNITNCHFEKNTARIGAAVDMYCRPANNVASRECSIAPEIVNCTFVNNGGLYTYLDGCSGATLATVNLDHLLAIFRDNITFYQNEGTALYMRETVVKVKPSAFVNFTRNTGRNGGGIAFIGKSWMVLTEKTSVIFHSNAVTGRGGAIYATQLLDTYSAYSYSCFFRYIKPHLHPDCWNAKLYFSNNTEFVLGRKKHQNSIYASSILPCIWPSGEDSNITTDIDATFCQWESWIFDNESNCTADILTSAGYFGQQEYNISVYAGLKHPLGIQVFDDLHQLVTHETLFSISSKSDSQLKSTINSHNKITVHGNPNTSSSILLQTTGSRTVYSKVNIDFLPCPPGLLNQSMSCTCNGPSFRGSVICRRDLKNDSSTAIFLGYCISYSDVKVNGILSKQVIVSRCPFHAGFQIHLGLPYVPLPNNVSELDKVFCKEHRRTEKLCSICADGKEGVSVFSTTYNCIECTKPVTSWLKFFAVTFLPLTIFFIIVVVFQVGVTSAQVNGYIFFSQIITIPLEVLILQSGWALVLESDVGKHALSNVLLFPYSVWSLDFFRIFQASNLCLSKSMRIMHVLALQYIPAFYPLFLVLISYILIELHARNCRPVVWLWKPFCFRCIRFRRNWEAKTSIVDAFATFLLLSYSKILIVSISLLTPSEVYLSDDRTVGKILNYDPSVEFFQEEHLPFAVLALFLLATFGALPPLLLLLYPSHTFQNFLDYFHLRSHGLQTFVDAFQGCYRNGADGGPERRYFAGIYFVFRIIVFLVFTVIGNLMILFMVLVVTYIAFILIFVILRPYKNDLYNTLDTVFISILAVTSVVNTYLYTHLLQYHTVPKYTWYFAYSLLHVPNVYMAGYILYWFCIRSRCVRTHCISKLHHQDQNRDVSDNWTLASQASRISNRGLPCVSSFPDRIENPHRYVDLSSSDNDGQRSDLLNENENAPLREDRRRNYGSVP